ncbi:ATP-binding cassette domain-containing protein [Massilia sp. 9I]|uniref:ATP-binding cassette domain-containing protein n=1 Tax=Massilia sp. 9I TaxID=2653152 RepID=UPI0012F24743|nr:ATP-binding cassette domain-containing protein [Massilia sp. 9I]VXB21049.1 ABC transporter ATP-binding protein uup-1 [Massilia sp. 9I]
MAVISLTSAQLAFGHVALLDHADFSLETGERVGLIGRNGTGKSSLLKIISGRSKLDDGLLVMQQGVTIAYVEQEPVFDPESTVFDAVARGMGEQQAMLSEYEALTGQFGGDNDEALMERMHELQLKLDAIDGWNLARKVDTTLDRLGLNRDAKMGTLSGGMQKRVALAVALVSSPDVLLLDEPTNHLDFTSIKWLEGLLREFRGSVLFITHDRSFLDNVATRILELDRGRLLSFPGNFSTYQERKRELLANEEVENAKFDKFLAQEEVWIRKGVQARRTRDEGRVRRLEALRLQRAARREQQGTVRLDVGTGERSGKIVAELENISKSYGEKVIVSNFTGTILRGDKVGLIGPNGAGKTTLLKIILGDETPDSGSAKLGTKLNVAYFDQMRAQLNEEASLADTISPGSDWVEINGQKKHVMTYLNDFLFAPERARSPVKSLSGGERNRLLLARLFAKPANCLVLDEPTNDLDIETLELLEELLEEYTGTVFLVSHDRTFLDNVVTQVIVAEGNGLWREYVGGYTDWERARASEAARPAPVVQKAMASSAASASASPGQPASKAGEMSSTAQSGSGKKVKLSYKEQRELEELPQLIATLEDEQSAIAAMLNSPDFYKQNPGDARRITERHAEIDDLLLDALERWERIEARARGE